jgi:hypothetical protein
MPGNFTRDTITMQKPSVEWMARHLKTHKSYRVHVEYDTKDGYEWLSTLWHLVQGIAIHDPELHVVLNAEEDPTWMEILVVE